MDTQYQPHVIDEGGSKKKNCLISCLVVGLILVIILVVGAYYIYKNIGKKLLEFPKKYVELGYEKKTGQVETITEDIQGDFVYVCQMLEVKATIDGNLAVASQTANISGEVTGNIDFKGQVIQVNEEAVVGGDLSVMAQVVEIKGLVEGDISGECQVITLPAEYKDHVSVMAQTINFIDIDLESPDKLEESLQDTLIETATDSLQ